MLVIVDQTTKDTGHGETVTVLLGNKSRQHSQTGPMPPTSRRTAARPSSPAITT